MQIKTYFTTPVVIPGDAFIDQLLFHPRDAQMSVYTYDPLTGITATTNMNNVTTYCEYDEFCRLKVIRDSDKNIETRIKILRLG